eukprot:scaffold124879_cov27-Tisochrysis_lutea.AAC.1
MHEDTLGLNIGRFHDTTTMYYSWWDRLTRVGQADVQVKSVVRVIEKEDRSEGYAYVLTVSAHMD